MSKPFFELFDVGALCVSVFEVLIADLTPLNPIRWFAGSVSLRYFFGSIEDVLTGHADRDNYLRFLGDISRTSIVSLRLSFWSTSEERKGLR